MKRILPASILVAVAALAIAAPAQGQSPSAPVAAAAPAGDAEARVLGYIKDHVQPGQPLVVSELYSKVFTQPDERKALDKLYNAFFRIPLFLVQYQEKFGKPPSLETIGQQFDLPEPGAADVLLRVMESDPRVPRFLTRDPQTGDVTHVDVAMVRSDPRFGQAVSRQLSGWEGQPDPGFKLPGFEGADVDSAALRGKVVLLYVWFTGCPPCMKETPYLVALQQELAGSKFTVVGANSDRVLGLDYDDAVRHRYAQEQKINFPLAQWTKESDAAFGHISIFPTLFLIDRRNVIVQHWVGFTTKDEIRHAIQAAAGSSASTP
jgi:thiol-disulfide isomerase/thioredoxin